MNDAALRASKQSNSFFAAGIIDFVVSRIEMGRQVRKLYDGVGCNKSDKDGSMIKVDDGTGG